MEYWDIYTYITYHDLIHVYNMLDILIFICVCLCDYYFILGVLVEDIKYGVQNFRKVVFQYTSVACDNAAHVLAREVLLSCNIGSWVEDCPTFRLVAV